MVFGEFVGKCCSLGCHVLCIRREVLCAIFTLLRLLNSCICVTTTSIFELEAHARDPSCNTNFEPQAIQLANPSRHGCFVVRVVLLGPSWHSSQSIHSRSGRPGVRLSVAKDLASEGARCVLPLPCRCPRRRHRTMNPTLTPERLNFNHGLLLVR